MLYVIFRVAAVAYNCCMEISLDSNPTELQTESPSEVKPFLVKTKSDEKPRRTAAEVQSMIERRSLELA
jgi:hypothetical protein